MKRIGKSLLCYWSAKKVCDLTNDEDLDNGEMNHEDLTDANKDSLQSKDTDSDTNDSELESEEKLNSSTLVSKVVAGNCINRSIM